MVSTDAGKENTKNLFKEYANRMTQVHDNRSMFLKSDLSKYVNRNFETLNDYEEAFNEVKKENYEELIKRLKKTVYDIKDKHSKAYFCASLTLKNLEKRLRNEGKI